MHDSKFILLLCYSVLAFSFIRTEALNQGGVVQKAELGNASQWDELKNTDSDTVNTATEKCEEILVATRTRYQSVIQHLQQLLPQIMTSSTLKSHVEDAIGEISKVMHASSRNVDKQLEDLGEIFLKRLNTVINAAQAVNPGVTADLEQIYRTEIDETDKLAISIRLFVAEDYNPLTKILPTMHKSQNYHADHIDEFRKIVKNDLDLLLIRLNQEFDQLESVIIGVLNRISKSMTIMKIVYASIKKTGQLPREWAREYIMEVLRQGTLMSKTASVDDSDFPLMEQEEPDPQSPVIQPIDTQVDTFKLDDGRSSEEDDEEEREEDDLGCVLIFSRTKRRMLKELIVTVTKIKSLHSIKEIDHQSLKILDDYRMVFHELHLQLVSKIVDYTHNFVKLYKMHIEIMDLINPGMKLKMQTIFDDTSVDRNNPIYGEIQRFLNSNFLTTTKIAALRQQIDSSIRGAKTLKEIQKKVSKELVTITTLLGKDLEEMKMVIVYILEEMREGVLALKHLKENANITGYRFLINFYDGKDDLKQLKKLIMILNMLDINLMFDRELAEIASSNQIKVSQGITNLLLNEINGDSTKFNEELDKSANITEVKKTITKYIIDFNKMIHNFTYKLRKSVKRMVTMFITVHEEFIILVNRRQIQNVDLEKIPESADLEAEIGLILFYLAENAQVDVINQYGGRFNIDSSNIDKSKAVVKQQMHKLIQTMSTELSQLDLQVENIIDKIIQEARNIEIMKQELTGNENLSIQEEQFPNLGLILFLSDFLQVLSVENNVKKSHSQEVNKTFNNAQEQIQAAKVNAERAIQESTDMSQLKVHVAETTTNIRSVLLDIGSDIKENLTEMSSNFMNMFETFTSTNPEVKEQILNANVEMEVVSEQLQDYLTNRYANHVLSPFNQILLHTPHSLNMAQSKETALISLNETMEKIEHDMDLVKKETIINIVEKLSQGIELMEHLQNRGKLVTTEEETSLLAMGNNIVGILQNFFSTDSTYNADEMQNAINLARESVTKEFSRAMTSIQSMANEADIKVELTSSAQSIANTYTSLSTNIQSQLQSFATTFTESYESAMSNVLGKNDALELTMQDIMNGQIASKQSIELENTIAFINSDAFLAASEWLSSLFQSIMQDSLAHSNSIKQASTHQLDSLHGYVDNAIGNMHEAVVSLVEDFKQSSTIIQLIKNDQKVDLNNDQINMLSNSFKLIQMLTQESPTTSSNDDFSSAKQLIAEEYQNTVRAIESLNDNAIIHDLTVKAVDSYNNIYENLRSETAELFAEKTTEFSASYNSIKEMAEYTGNVDLQNMLAEITENKETLQPSQELQEVEAFVKSEKFTSSTVVQNVFENQPQVPDIQKLNKVTTQVESYIGEMEQVSSFVQAKFAAATEFLTSIENSNIIQWSLEQITIVTETISITESLSPNDSSETSGSSSESNSAEESDHVETSDADVRSLNQTTQETATIISNNFSEARNKILVEFDNAQNLIETATDETSVQQTVSIGIERISTIFGNLQNELRDDINNTWRRYTNSIEETRNKVAENAQLQTILQDILENNKYSPSLLDADFSRLSTIITSDIYQSTNLVNTMYEQIHSNFNVQSNMGLNEKSLEELRLVITNISQDIVEMEFSETYIQEKLEQGSVILKDIESGVIEQLSEEQIKILAVTAQIGELLQIEVNPNEIPIPSLPSAETSISPASPVDISYISESRGLINTELQATLNTIQSMETEEGIIEATTVTIQKTENMFNELKTDFQGQVVEILTEFKEDYASVIEITQNQGNVQLTEILENAVNSENIDTNATFGGFQSFMESTVITSSTVITDMFQAFKADDSPTENIKEWNTNALQTISTNINEHITQIENVAIQVQDTLQQGINILETIKSEPIVELTEEQISVISSSIQLEQILPTQKPVIVHVTEEEFIETEVAIKQEFDRTIAALELLTDEVAINDMVATTIGNVDSIFTILKEKVQIEITTTVTTFEEMVTTLETSSHGHDNTLLEQVDEIFQGETVVQNDQTLVQIENFLTSDVYTSPSTVQALFNNIQHNEELNIAERNIQSIKELDVQVTDNIETMHGVSQNIFQSFEQGTEILKILQNDNEADFTDEQVQVLSVCHELSKVISPKAENSVTSTVPTETISEGFNEVEVEVNESTVWNMFGLLSNDQPDINLTQTKEIIHQEYSKTVEILSTLSTEEEVQPVVSSFVDNSNTVYNTARENIHNKMAENAQSMLQHYNSAINNDYKEESKNLQKIMRDLNTEAYEFEANADYEEFETFVTSSYFTSVEAIKETFITIQEETPVVVNDSIVERNIQQLGTLNQKTEEYIDEIERMDNYVNNNFQQVSEILTQIENNEIIDLTKDQIQTLTLGQEIIHNLVTREETMEITPENQIQTESVLQTITEIDITITITTLTEELNTSVQAIESAPDADTVQQIVNSSVEKYEEVFSTVRTEMQTKMTETVSTYENDYSETLNTVLESGNNNTANILQNIDTIQTEESETLKEFESLINSDTYKSPSPIADTYNALRQEDTISSLTSFNEKGVQELNLLNQQVMENINQMQTTTSYAEQNLQSGLDILHAIQADAAADLTDDQVKELVLSHKVAEVVKTTISQTEITSFSDVETINLDNTGIQENGIDTATAINTIQEDYEEAINSIRLATETEDIQTVITDNIQNLDSVYCRAQETVEHEIDINITQFSEARDSLIVGNTAEIDNGVRNILENIPEQRANFETDENFKQFENFVRSNRFQSPTLANDMYQQIQQNENQHPTNINERAEEELTLLNTQVKGNIDMLEQTKEYVNRHIGQGTQILQTAQQNPAYHPTEEELVELSLSQTIISTLLSVTVVESETQTELVEEVDSLGPESEATINEIPVAVDIIQNKKEEAVNQIRELTEEESIKQVVEETVYNFDAQLSEVQQSTDQKLHESTRLFEENYQSVIQLIEEGDSEQYKRILEGELNFTPDDQFEMFEKYMKNNGSKLPTAGTILSDVEENGELITHDINEKYAVELDIVSTQVTNNIVELTEMTTYATKNLEKGSEVLNLIVADQNIELQEQQIQEVILSQRIMQVITTAAVTEEQAEIVQPTLQEQVHEVQPIPKVDFVNVELEIDKKVDESVQKINLLTDEAEIVQVVEENVHESSTMYSELEHNVRQKIDISSANFMETFQTTMSNTPEESPLRAILSEMLTNNNQFPSDLNEEFQQVQSEINDQNIMSSSAVDQIYNNIRESETLPVDIKERSITELKTLNEEVKKNIVTMKHIDDFVCTNLQDGLAVLQDIEGQKVEELTEEQIRSLSIGTTISETVTTQVETESTSWSTFLSFGTVVVPSTGEAEQSTIQSSTTEVDNNLNIVQEGDDIIQVTRSVTSITEIQEISTTIVGYEEEASQCVTQNNMISVKEKITNPGPISVNDLVVTVNANSLSFCQHLKWNTNRLSPEDKQTIEEIREYLLAAQNIFATSIPVQQNRINLCHNINDVLVIFVNTTELMDEVLQQLSFVILEKIVSLITPILTHIENNDIQRELENTSSNLDAEFINSIKLFFSLMFYERTDIMTMVDEQFANVLCSSMAISKEIILRKFSVLNEIMEKILSRILCITLMIIDLIVNSKISLQTNVQRLELIKNIQLLYDIISQIHN